MVMKKWKKKKKNTEKRNAPKCETCDHKIFATHGAFIFFF